MKNQKYFKKVSLFPLSVIDNKLLFRFYHCGSCYLFASNIPQCTSLRTDLGIPYGYVTLVEPLHCRKGWVGGGVRGGRNCFKITQVFPCH